jgi:hypothetical protein
MQNATATPLVANGSRSKIERSLDDLGLRWSDHTLWTSRYALGNEIVSLFILYKNWTAAAIALN